jgi:hypothetical protein
MIPNLLVVAIIFCRLGFDQKKNVLDSSWGCVRVERIPITGSALFIIISLEETALMRHRLGDSGTVLFRVLEASPVLCPSWTSPPGRIGVW